MEYNIELLRESAILDYQEALSGKLTIDPDKLFMESCIDAGFTMDEAVDAALQKIRLYMSEEAKICKRLAKETQKAIKKRDWETAVKTSQKRLAHLENLEKRADDIDDDEIYILQMESMAKAFVLTTIISMILVKIADGIVPGSGWLIDAFKKYIQKFRFKDFRKSLSAGGGILNFARDLLAPILTIAGFSKKVSNKMVSSKTKKWQKNRNGDINREVNEGRPDLSTMSVSRTEAKTRFRKMIEAQKQEIAVLKANMNAPKKQESVKNESVILYESAALISSGCSDKMEILQEAKLKAAARNELPDSAFGIPEDRKYPLNDAAHVKAAIKMFSHCPDAKKAALAKRIVSAMSKFGVDITFDEKSPMYNYVPKKYQK